MIERTMTDRLALLDQSGLTVRDVRILDSINSHPGENGSDIFERLGLHSRSSVQNSLPKMIKYGLIIDTREREGQAIPGCYYITDKGREFLGKIMQ